MNKVWVGILIGFGFIAYTLAIAGGGLYLGYSEGATNTVVDVIEAAQKEIDKHEAVIEILKEQIHELLDRLQERKFDRTGPKNQWGVIPNPGVPL